MTTSATSLLPSQIESHRAEIDVLCARFGVRRLELFGSAAAGTFDPSRSDFDFLVDFTEVAGLDAFNQYFGFKEELEKLFGRSVDLVSAGTVTNPYLRQSIDRNRRLLYAA